MLSRIVRLRLAYEGEAEGAPPSLIFKTGLPERLSGGWNAGRQEVEFYAKVAATTPPGILPRCFEAEWDEKTNDWRLILEDLGDSHKIVTTWPLPPTLSECEAIVRAWRLGVATDDLAYMMAVHWYPDRRRRMERSLLDAYHAAVLAHGVGGYDRRALDDDYRLSALWQIVTPVFRAAANIPTVIWWNNFERIHLAVEDLGSRELLE